MRLKKSLCILGAIAGAVLIAGALAPPAIAQIRAALVRDMDSPIRGTRHVEVVDINFSNGAFSASEVITPLIPIGKKLFVQSIVVHALLTDGQGIMEARLTVGPSFIAQFWLDMRPQASGPSQSHFTGNQDINMILNAGETLTMFLFRNNDLGSSSLNFARGSIVGYLVDANP